MEKVRLGRTELMVTRPGVGCIPIIRRDFDGAVDLIRYAFDRGINFFDTARVYADSEDKVGAALKYVRKEVVLASKTMGRDAQTAAGNLEESLKRLKTDYIDIYQIHNISNQETLDAVLGPRGAYQALAEAKKQGKIGHIGFSSHNERLAEQICLTNLFDTVQIPFNFVESDPAQKLIPTALSLDMGVIGMKPLGGGLLLRADLCFGFLRAYDGVVPDPGVEHREELDEILALYESPQDLTPEQLADMERLKQEVGSRFCHRCEYCLPCPQEVMIPFVLMYNSLVRRMPPERVINLCQKSMASAENCIECGECEKKCPYELPVSEMVQETLAAYKEFYRQHGG